MKPKLSAKYRYAVLLLLLCVLGKVNAQCSFTGSLGTTVSIAVTPYSLVKATTDPAGCQYGYSYNVTYKYEVLINKPANVNLAMNALQFNSSCGSQTFFTGIPLSNTSSTGYITSSNSYTSSANCATDTYSSLGCASQAPVLYISFTETLANTTQTYQTTQSCPYSQTLLPVYILGFNAALLSNTNTVKVDWKNSAEINNKKFELQRSADQLSWKGIYEVVGSITSTTVKNYTYTDTKPLSGVSYYRLKQTDVNGSINYSSVVSVNIKKASQSIQVSSNPGNGKSLQIAGLTNSEQWKIVATDITGKPVFKTNISGSKISLPEQLPSGIYVLSFLNGITGEKTIVKYQKL